MSSQRWNHVAIGEIANDPVCSSRQLRAFAVRGYLSTSTVLDQRATSGTSARLLSRLRSPTFRSWRPRERPPHLDRRVGADAHQGPHRRPSHVPAPPASCGHTQARTAHTRKADRPSQPAPEPAARNSSTVVEAARPRLPIWSADQETTAQHRPRPTTLSTAVADPQPPGCASSPAARATPQASAPYATAVPHRRRDTQRPDAEPPARQQEPIKPALLCATSTIGWLCGRRDTHRPAVPVDEQHPLVGINGRSPVSRLVLGSAAGPVRASSKVNPLRCGSCRRGFQSGVVVALYTRGRELVFGVGCDGFEAGALGAGDE